MVAMHDLENFVPDALALAATANAGDHEPDQVPVLRLLEEGGGELQGEPILGVGQFARFGVEVPLPIKLPDG